MSLFNCYDLFERVARRSLGLSDSDPLPEYQLRGAYEYLCSAFHGSEEVDYSQPLVRAAYTLVFAPRYAIYWRCLYALNEFRSSYGRLRNPQSGVLRLNCIGAGPGSEIAGITASGIPALGRADLNIVDSQADWLPMVNDCLTELEGISAVTYPNMFHYQSLEDLEAGWPIVGSFVLSDVARNGDLPGFLDAVAKRARSQPAIFMDTYKFIGASGIEHKLEDNLGRPRDWTINLHRECDLNRAAMDEFESAPRFDFQKPQSDPKVAVFKFKFQ